MALTIFFVLLTHLVSAHSFMGERDNFIVVRQDFSQQQILKSIAADGSEKMIDVFSKNSYVEVIPPFIYIHKHDQKELRVLTREGHQVFNLSHCEKFSANTFGLLVLRTNKQLETYVIKGQSFILVPTLLENVDQFKMSDTIIMVNRVSS